MCHVAPRAMSDVAPRTVVGRRISHGSRGRGPRGRVARVCAAPSRTVPRTPRSERRRAERPPSPPCHCLLFDGGPLATRASRPAALPTTSRRDVRFSPVLAESASLLRRHGRSRPPERELLADQSTVREEDALAAVLLDPADHARLRPVATLQGRE